MRKHDDYIPSNKLQFAAWLLNFLKKLAKYVNHYGINQEQIKTVEPLAQAYQEDMAAEQDLLNQKLAQFEKTANDRKAVEAICRKLAQGIKSSLDYTTEIGKEFEIIGDETEFDPKTYKPVINLRRVSNGVELSFLKSQTDGVNVYRCKKGEADMQFLAFDTHSPYIDTKEMDEHVTYQYQVWGVIKNVQIGLASKIVEITV